MMKKLITYTIAAAMTASLLAPSISASAAEIEDYSDVCAVYITDAFNLTDAEFAEEGFFAEYNTDDAVYAAYDDALLRPSQSSLLIAKENMTMADIITAFAVAEEMLGEDLAKIKYLTIEANLAPVTLGETGEWAFDAVSLGEAYVLCGSLRDSLSTLLPQTSVIVNPSIFLPEEMDVNIDAVNAALSALGADVEMYAPGEKSLVDAHKANYFDKVGRRLMMGMLIGLGGKEEGK